MSTKREKSRINSNSFTTDDMFAGRYAAIVTLFFIGIQMEYNTMYNVQF